MHLKILLRRENALALEGRSARRDQDRTLWEITIDIDESARTELLGRLNALPSARFVGWSDRVFDRHWGGKIEMHSRVAVSTQQILRDIDTPGVARVCLAICTAPGSVPTDTQRAEEPPEVSGPQSGAP
jgi:malate dehydrogenase (oxaloacetate-decarboxylating)